MSTPIGRKRARIACKTCRELKRKCDGRQPCGICVRFEYDCIYQGAPSSSSNGNSRKRVRKDTLRRYGVSPPPPPSSLQGGTVTSPPDEETRTSNPTPTPPLHSNTRSLEANSGPTFLRRLALRLDPHSAPRLHTFAWNAFLGARKSGYIPISSPPPPITRVLSLATMQNLALAYFQRVDPTYGFVDRRDTERYVEQRWASPGAGANAVADPMRDAILCGIAALGCLFSHAQPTKAELDLAESARLILERAISDIPTAASITAWLLRVVYLRISDTHHTAWMASCMLMHMVEAAGLHREPSSSSLSSSDSTVPSPPQGVDLELRRRLVGVSQHLNIWTSFDMGRSRVLLSNATVATPSRRPGDQTAELMELLPYSAELDPQKSPSGPELETALLEVTERVHSTPPSVLAQCNLALCLCRRLQSMGASFAAGRVLDQMLALCSRGIRAARETLDDRAPWHHLANVPFQIVCLLLAIDNDSSTPCLKDAISCLSDVARVYNTDAIQEALRMASSLIALHIRWKEKCTAALRDILVTLPDSPPDGGGGNVPTSALAFSCDDTQWLNGLSEDLSTLPCFDIDEFMVPTFLRD